MKKFLPDSNIFIKASKGVEEELTFLNKLIKNGDLIISVVAVGEFYSKATESEKQIFDDLMTRFGVLGIDEEVAKTAGNYRKEFIRKSKKVFLLDCFIAAQAKLNNLILVTNNKSDFPMKDIQIISPYLCLIS